MPRITPQRWTIFSLLILLAGAAWIGISRAPQGSTTGGKIPLPRLGFVAPDFSLSSTSGETVSLANLRGRPVLVNLWTSWCPPCKAEMPALQRVYTDYQDQGLEILAVNSTHQDNLTDAAAFAEELGLSFPILVDGDGDVSRLYALSSLPTSFFIDRQGVIREVVIGGPMSEALLRIRVEQLLEE
jgi:peroxiredoxin